MAFSEALASRVRDAMAGDARISEKKMFGGLCFLFNGKMLVCVLQDSLIARIGPDEARTALRKPHVKKFELTRGPMKGWVVVDAEGLASDVKLKSWVQLAIEFVVTLA